MSIEDHQPGYPRLLSHFLQLVGSEERFFESCGQGVLRFRAPGLDSRSDPDRHRTVFAKPDLTGLEYAVPLAKRPNANPFPGMITVGRVTNNDVVLPYGGISRFHAFFMYPGGDSSPLLQDSGSLTGTFVEGERLTPRVTKARLRDQAKVAFGGLECVFHTPEGFRDALRSPQ